MLRGSELDLSGTAGNVPGKVPGKPGNAFGGELDAIIGEEVMAVLGFCVYGLLVGFSLL